MVDAGISHLSVNFIWIISIKTKQKTKDPKLIDFWLVNINIKEYRSNYYYHCYYYLIKFTKISIKYMVHGTW